MQQKNQISDFNSVIYWMGTGALGKAEAYLNGFSKVFILMDENIDKFCFQLLIRRIRGLSTAGVIQVRSGEINKHLQTVTYIWEKLTEMEADRDSLLLNLGGGVITDMGGFAASTFKRGMPFINIPTTLLGQVDAAIGGKTGIDFREFKNHIGVFSSPLAVVIDPAFLETLEDVQWKSGFAEVLKYGFIMDVPLLDKIGDRSYQQLKGDWEAVILRAARDKIKIVETDGLEKGLRKILNFGHTIGHALETWFLKTDNPITHGEAVAAGMICESWVSHQLVGLKVSELDEIARLIDKSFARLSFPPSIFPELLQLTKQDKKVRKGSSKYSLLKSNGEGIFDVVVDDKLVVQSLEYYLNKL